MATEYAVRYARALMDVLESGKAGNSAGNSADVEAAGRELGEFEAAWMESAGLRHVFLDPSISAAKKVAILDKLNERLAMSKPVRNLLAVIANHERMEGLEAILDEFRRMVREDLGIDRIEWTSARALNEDERRAVEAKIAELTGKRIEATFREDKALLGGARLRIGSTIYDGSVRGRLDGMRERLAN